MKYLQHTTPVICALVVFVFGAGCQADLDESAYTFACDGDGDCSGIYECLPSDEYETDICQLPSDVETSDAGDTEDTSTSDTDDATDSVDDGSETDTSSADVADTADGEDTGDACEVTNGGEEICDGLDNDCDGEADEGFEFRATLVENGLDHACAITTDNEVYCWGDNTSGKAIPGEDGADLDHVRRPMRVTGISSAGPIDDLALGPNHSCALQDGTRIYCWGDNGRKQLGMGSPISGELTEWSVSEINEDGPPASFSDIEAGMDFSCGRAGDGNLYCWGAASQLRMGVDVPEFSVATPVQFNATQDFDVFDLGQTHGCGIDTPQQLGSSTSDVLCWGTNAFGQVGVSDTGNQLPTAPRVDFGEGDPDLVGLMSVASGDRANCGLNGEDLLCWGDNNTGQLAVPDGSTDQPEAVSVQPPTGYGIPTPGVDEEYLAMGEQHGCALASDGRAFCWGGGREGQLGDGMPGQIRYETVAVDPEIAFDSIAAGGKFTCAVEEWSDDEEGGRVYCWGFNASHQLGLGVDDDRVADATGGDMRIVNRPTAVACGVDSPL